MQELPTPDAIRVAEVVERHITATMEELNELHTESSFSDEDIVHVLRMRGYGYEADLYEDWIRDEDPPRRINEPDPEGPGGYVTDPGDSDTNRMIAQEQDRRRATAMEMLREAKDVPPTEEP